MKKILALVLVAAILASFAACNSGTPAQSAKTAEPPAGEKSYKIFMVLRQIGDAYYDTIGNGAVEWGKANGHDVQYVAPTEYDAAAQIALIQDCIAQKPDAILCSPVSNEACEPVFKEARDAGIIVIVNEAEGMTNVDWDVEYLASQPYAEAWIELMASKNGGEGDYVCMVGSLQNAAEVARCKYAVEYAKEHYPNMNLVAPEPVEPAGDTADAHLALFKELLTKYPNLRSILSAQSVAQASLAIEEANLVGTTFCAGEAIPSEITQYVKNGAGASIVADLTTCGGALAAVAVKMKNGESIESGMNLGIKNFDACLVNAEKKLIEANGMLVITDENIDQYNF